MRRSCTLFLEAPFSFFFFCWLDPGLDMGERSAGEAAAGLSLKVEPGSSEAKEKRRKVFFQKKFQSANTHLQQMIKTDSRPKSLKDEQKTPLAAGPQQMFYPTLQQ